MNRIIKRFLSSDRLENELRKMVMKEKREDLVERISIVWAMGVIPSGLIGSGFGVWQGIKETRYESIYTTTFYASGLGLIDDVIIDTHFVQRGRIGRLFQAVVGNPKTLGIGLGEDTGLLITNGFQMEAIGSGLVILVDGKQIKDTNLTEVELGQPISINNFVVHVMSMNDKYDLKTNIMSIHSSQYI